MGAKSFSTEAIWETKRGPRAVACLASKVSELSAWQRKAQATGDLKDN